MDKLLWGLLAAVIMMSQPARANEPYCRPFTQAIDVDRQAQEATGTACMRSDGTWSIVPEEPYSGVGTGDYQAPGFEGNAYPNRPVTYQQLYGGSSRGNTNYHHSHRNGSYGQSGRQTYQQMYGGGR